MKILRFHRTSTHVHLMHLITKRFLWVAFLVMISQALPAQKEGEVQCNFSANANIGCENVTVNFSANSSWPTHEWDFGDGSPILSGGQSLWQTSHLYVDVNPYTTPLLIAKHRLDNTSMWCEREFQEFLPGIFLGTGCGSIRKVSEMVAANKLPANELVGRTLYIFGNLEVDVSYKFDACNIFVSGGGKITVKSGATLTLKSNTIVDAHTVSGSCQSLWKGIEVLSGGSLTTNGATIKNAYFAINTVNPDNLALMPKLNLQNTVFQRNFVGIYATKGRFAISLFRHNTFEGSGNGAIYSLGNCGSYETIANAPYANRTYCGIYFDGSLGGSLLLGVPSFNNVFKNLQAGIVCINGTSTIKGCSFDNIAFLNGINAMYQGTAVTFVDNKGGKTLSITGLGKNAIPTINNCERGVYALTSKPATQAFVTDCRMLEVQNGVELDVSGTGNFLRGTASNCFIGLTKYLGIIKVRSTGIEIKDPNIAFSNFTVSGNDIDVDQIEAYEPSLNLEIVPTGIVIIAMHNQAPNNTIAVSIASNIIHLIKGQRGVLGENIANANILGNQIQIDYAVASGIASWDGIYLTGGINNTATCNSVVYNGSSVATVLGLVCMNSPNVIFNQNHTVDALGGLNFGGDNGTSCMISYNNIEALNIHETGIYYEGGRTGPQNLTGNDWIGSFFKAARYINIPDGFSHCNSIYHVSLDAGAVPIQAGSISCDSDMNPDPWFNYQEASENDFNCGNQTPNRIFVKNESDLYMASGGTTNLSLGYKWTAETDLIRKFTEYPSLATGDNIINNFLTVNQNQPVTAMYNVRKNISSIENSVTASIANNIQSALTQLEATRTNMLALLENIDSDPNSFASFTTLSTQTETLEGLLVSYLISASSSIALSAANVGNTNNSISSSALPCAAERYINGLYLETQFVSPRALTLSELNAVQQIGLYCIKDAGNIVPLARAWYYLQTGISLSSSCENFNSLLEESERNEDVQTKQEGNLLLIPNPSNAEVEIMLPANLGKSTLSLIDIWGKLILQRNLDETKIGSSIIISLETVPSGVYFIFVKENSGKQLVRKLTVTH